MAVLAGMATAATVVLIHGLRSTLNDPLHSTMAGASDKSGKPSAFGTMLTSSTPPDVKLTPPQIAKSGNRAIVTVTGFDRNDKPISQGIGYIHSSSGIIITSFTAIRGASSVTIQTAAGDELSVIALMGYSPERDLAALAVLEGSLPALDSGATEVVEEGDPVVVIGADNAISKGAVGARRAVGGVDLIQITAPAPVGAPPVGAPVLNERAQVIGIVTNKHFGPENQTLAIPSRYVSDLLAEQHVISFAQMLEETSQAASAGQ
jgi:hypothetical protein